MTATEDQLEAARLLDLRRQAQVEKQVEIINRLLGGEATWTQIQADLVEDIARFKVEVDELNRELTKAKALLHSMRPKR